MCISEISEKYILIFIVDWNLGCYRGGSSTVNITWPRAKHSNLKLFGSGHIYLHHLCTWLHKIIFIFLHHLYLRHPFLHRFLLHVFLSHQIILHATFAHARLWHYAYILGLYIKSKWPEIIKPTHYLQWTDKVSKM